MRHNFLPGMTILILVFLSSAALAEKAERHGCLVNEPDRDEDGVPDIKDPFPDDPTRPELESEA